MNISIFDNEIETGKTSAVQAAHSIRKALQNKDIVNIILATGTSQFELLKHGRL